MKIVLFENEQIFDFLLPSKPFGSFRFDKIDGEENKLINVEAQKDSWVLKSTSGIKVYDIKGNYLDSVNLKINTFYILEREENKYLIYVDSVFDNTFVKYRFNNDLNLTIGRTKKCNVFYDNEVIKGELFSLKQENDNIVLETTNHNSIYINKRKINADKITIACGDVIQCYSIIIIVLKNVILFNNPDNKIFINDLSQGLEPLVIEDDTTLNNLEIKEKDLYNENEYFSKSPRVRRIIQNKTIKIDSPPSIGEENQMPLFYTLGPMITMAMYSVVNLINTLIRISSGETTLAKSWSTLMISIAMMLTTLLWPNLTRRYQKKQNKKRKEKNIRKYREYLEKKRVTLDGEIKLQKDILNDNLIPTLECYNIAINKKMGLWSRRIEQDDFLTVRLGVGATPLAVNFEIPEEGFTTEENTLLEEALDIAKKNTLLQNAPIGYSFSDKMISAFMGNESKVTKIVENILVQLTTFHSYDDLKIVFMTNKKNEHMWDFMKYLPHSFSDDKQIRFFSSNIDEAKAISSHLEHIVNQRRNSEKDVQHKPYYLIISDDYSMIKRTNIIKTITETNDDYGFRLIILENKLGKLPSKCNNFISIGDKNSSILENAYENQKMTNFTNEIVSNLDMNVFAKTLLNIPIEYENARKELPNTISFLEMENVGKVEQLNIINRWKENDSTLSLKSEIGIDENGDIMFLDIHEKYHGPHGLIAGMTGSGKSEFIITYVLSMAINYSPNDVAFILIDYKGGGLAGAFENKSVGIKLPHLAGTITNLDKAEMDRTLVSIDSEIRRRQMLFNEAKELLGESTMDIYKYQRLFKEGKLTNPIPHLIIICDEFAELKSQQPDFMDDLISIARIGRSLGVHLILATQKPSGVVNDQIWSNSKFRVCLKVQDASDSKEMLKRAEAATIKQAGRFYLQVGYDELFMLGQSAWCGAKYYPSEKVKKIVDKSINFINNIGYIYKSITENTENKIVAQGEELNNILKHVIEAAKLENIFAKNLWLENIPAIILVDNLITKYNIGFYKHNIEAIIGEYDDPSNQNQGILKINLNEEGNTIVYGSIGSDREMFLESLLYSTMTRHSSEEINYYIIDYGSESLRKYKNFPHIGDMMFADDEEKLFRLIKMIKEIIIERKQLFAEYGGEYNNYIKHSESLPLIGIIINNFDAFKESNSMLEDELISLTRDCQRYGIFFVLAANNDHSVRIKLKQNFNAIFTLRFNDLTDYGMVLGRTKIIPKEIAGRGLFKEKRVYEFQTAHITDEQSLNEYINNIGSKLQQTNQFKAKAIPSMPEVVTIDFVREYLNGLEDVPIGVYESTLDIVKYNFTSNLLTPIISEKINNITDFSKGLITELSQIKNTQLIVIDTESLIEEIKNTTKYYYSKEPEKIIEVLINYVQQIKMINNNELKAIIYINYFSKFVEQVSKNKIEEFVNLLKETKGISLIITDEHKGIKNLSFDGWYRNIQNDSSGIWIGSGIIEQSVFKTSRLPRGVKNILQKNYGFIIDGDNVELFKTIECDKKAGDLND